MKYLLAIAACLICSAARADAPTSPIAPDGVTYVTASDEVNKVGSDNLTAAFSGDSLDLSALISKGIDKNGRVLLGVYLSQILAKEPTYVEGSLAGGQYLLPLDKKEGVTIHAKLLMANKQDQVKNLASLLAKIYGPAKPFAIRKLTKEEMALIWFYISWDLVEPIYVVDTNGYKLVFEFDPSGTSLMWIEDITAPCFRLVVGDSGLPCMCHVVEPEGNRYLTAFRPTTTCSGAADTKPPSK